MQTVEWGKSLATVMIINSRKKLIKEMEKK